MKNTKGRESRQYDMSAETTTSTTQGPSNSVGHGNTKKKSKKTLHRLMGIQAQQNERVETYRNFLTKFPPYLVLVHLPSKEALEERDAFEQTKLVDQQLAKLNGVECGVLALKLFMSLMRIMLRHAHGNFTRNILKMHEDLNVPPHEDVFVKMNDPASDIFQMPPFEAVSYTIVSMISNKNEAWDRPGHQVLNHKHYVQLQSHLIATAKDALLKRNVVDFAIVRRVPLDNPISNMVLDRVMATVSFFVEQMVMKLSSVTLLTNPLFVPTTCAYCRKDLEENTRVYACEINTTTPFVRYFVHCDFCSTNYRGFMRIAAYVVREKIKKRKKSISSAKKGETDHATRASAKKRAKGIAFTQRKPTNQQKLAKINLECEVLSRLCAIYCKQST